MNILKKILSLSLAVSIAVPCIAFADLHTDEHGELNYHGSIDVSPAILQESGIPAYDNMHYGKWLVYTVMSADDYANIENMSQDEYLSKILYVGQTQFDDNGEYDLSFIIKGNTGNYKILLQTPFSDADNVIDFEHTSYFYIEYNEAVDSALNENMIKFLDMYIQNLNSDSVAYSHMTNESKEKLASDLISAGKANSNDDVLSIVNNINITSIFVENCSSAAEFGAYYTELSKYSDNKYNKQYVSLLVNELSSDKRLSILDKYIGKPIADNFDSSITYDIFNALKSDITYYPEYDKLISYKGNPFGLNDFDISEYAQSDNQKGIQKAFAQNVENATDISAVRNAFHNAVKNPVKESDNSSANAGNTSRGNGTSSRGSVTIPVTNEAVTPGESNSNVSKFNDMNLYTWAQEAVNTLAANNIINGMTDTTFAPEQDVTREQFVKMLTAGLRMTGVEAEFSYNDVKPDDWFYNAVGAATRAGIATGYNGEFGVGKSITREDAAVMLTRAANNRSVALNENADISFADSNDISAYATSAVNKLASAGIVTGSDGRFYPKKSLTRAEAAKILYEFFIYTGAIQKGAAK